MMVQPGVFGVSVHSHSAASVPGICVEPIATPVENDHLLKTSKLMEWMTTFAVLVYFCRPHGAAAVQEDLACAAAVRTSGSSPLAVAVGASSSQHFQPSSESHLLRPDPAPVPGSRCAVVRIGGHDKQRVTDHSCSQCVSGITSSHRVRIGKHKQQWRDLFNDTRYQLDQINTIKQFIGSGINCTFQGTSKGHRGWSASCCFNVKSTSALCLGA